jgi:hypothetical protein
MSFAHRENNTPKRVCGGISYQYLSTRGHQVNEKKHIQRERENQYLLQGCKGGVSQVLGPIEGFKGPICMHQCWFR